MEIDWPGGDWQTSLNLVGAVFGTYYAAVWLSAIVWAYRDIRERTRDPLSQILAVFMVLVFSLPGLLLYLILRPRHTLADQYERTLEEEALLQGIEEQLNCPTCRRHIENDYVVCPFCAAQLKEPCSTCGKPTANSWAACPYCATPKRQSLTAGAPTGGRRSAPVVALVASAPVSAAPAAPAGQSAQPVAVSAFPSVTPPERPATAAPPPRSASVPNPSSAHTLVFEEETDRGRRVREAAPVEPAP